MMGACERIEAVMMSEMPFPRPCWVMSSPSHMVSITPVVSVTMTRKISTGLAPEATVFVRDDVVPARQQRLERGKGDRGSAREDQPQRARPNSG